jgi:alanine dehydrogenase
MIPDLGLDEASRQHEPIRKGVNVINHTCAHPGVAEACGVPFTAYGP